MRLSDVIDSLEALAPTSAAAKWDNVGLLVGDPAADVSRALFCIDYTRAVAAEATAHACELVVAYHPPIFEALKRFTSDHLAFDAARSGIAIWSPHTALDVAAGGTNDVLAAAVGIEDAAPLEVSESKDVEYKLVFFVPPANADAVCQAVFDAGAGAIGAYSACSFRAPGTGTFFGSEETNPAVGEKGKLERVEELRVETVVPIGRAAEVIAALRKAHPYEEPAFDLVKLAAAPATFGLGRIGAVARAPRREIVERVKRALGLTRVLVAGPEDGDASRAAVCAGSAGGLVREAARRGADVYVTGELRHHDALWAAARGMTVVCVLHSNSERAALAPLAARLRERCPSLAVRLSDADRDPFRVA
jgi:dinuclear metal center YbgI/SA1388 family protein